MLIYLVRRRYILCGITFVAYSSWLAGADERNDWLRGIGNDLEMRLLGEFVQEDGQPATDVQLTVESREWGVVSATRPLTPAVNGHRFDIWLPVNQLSQSSILLRAASTVDDRAACLALSPYEWRQAAIDGIQLKLQSPRRRIAVNVTDQGQPVVGAFVKAELESGFGLQATTDANGTAYFSLLSQQTLERLTAWTNDFRIGGYSLDSIPIRDTTVDDYTVVLSRCRDQVLQFVDADSEPLPRVEFEIHVSTALPNLNYIGTNEHSRLNTDANGQAIYKWLPDWDEHFCYVSVLSNEWVIDGDNHFVGDSAIFKLKRRKIGSRKNVTGTVALTDLFVGGFCVELRSFQGERESEMDVLTAFTNSDGSFSVNVLPDATYCAWVLDTRWVSDIVDLIPYDSTSDTTSSPRLSLSKGQVVEILATVGPSERPYPYLPIHLHREYPFSWWDEDGMQDGTGGPQWYVMTDELGRATTTALPGALEVSAYAPNWRTQQTVEVMDGKPTTIKLHRAAEQKRTIVGQLVLPEDLAANLAGATIKIGSVDGNYREMYSLKSDKNGRFSQAIESPMIGIFAATIDGQAAAAIVITDPETPIQLHLEPTMTFQGRLLDNNGEPLAGHAIRAITRVEGDRDYNASFPQSFEAFRVESRTDEQGNYTLRRIPSRTAVLLQTDSIDIPTRAVSLGKVYLEPGESRPREVSRLGKRYQASEAASLADQCQSMLRDGALAGFHLMLIVQDQSYQTTKFVEQNLMDANTNGDVASFMQFVVNSEKDNPDPDTTEFLKSRGLQAPNDGRIVACALNTNGDELGRLDIDISDESAVETVARFMREHAPDQVDAESRWSDAFADARRTNRRVWARTSQRYCGPCFRLARWLDDQRELIEKDFVLLKIDNARDKNGSEVANRLSKIRVDSVPFHAIFDANGEFMIDSIGPLGNVGDASGIDGRHHLRKMLHKSRQRLTDAEIDQLVDSLAE